MIISQYPSAYAETQQVTFAKGSSFPGCEKTNSCFMPSTITITKGDTVNFYNADSQTHIVTSGTPSTGHDGRFQPVVKIGYTQPIRFDTPGVYPYYCEVHPWTVGKIIVNDIKVTSISMNVSPSSIFEGENAIISGQVFASAPIARNTLVYEYKTNTGLSGSGWVDESGSIRMNVLWPLGTHTVTFNIKGDNGKITSNPVVLDIKSKEPPKTTITLEPMRDYGSITDGLAEFTGRLTTQDGIALSGKKVSVKFEKQGNVATEFDYTDSTGRYSVVFGFNGREGDWQVYSVYEDGVQFKAAQSVPLVFTVYPDPTPTKTPEPVKTTTPTTPEVKSSSATINVQLIKSYYNQGDIITATGTVSKNTGDSVVITVIDPNGNLILIDQVKVDSENNFVAQIPTDSSTWYTSGAYTITAQYGDSSDKEVIQYQANKFAPIVPPSSPPPAPTITTTSTKAPAGTDIIIPSGTSVPGCEKTNSCYLPTTLSFSSGKTVTWYNSDSAAHTVTSGTSQGGPDGIFDSNLFMAGTTFSHKFTQSGTFPYFCMVHPWMTGEVKVTGTSQSPPNFPTQLKVPIIVFTDKPSYTKGDIIEISGQIKSVIRGAPVTINVISANGDLISISQVEIDNDRKFYAKISTDGANWQKSGKYTVKATYGTEFRMAETTLEFNSLDAVTKPNPTTISTFTASAMTPELSESIIIFTDSSSYMAGDDIKFFGAVSEIINDYPVTIQVTNPNGKLVTEGQLKVDKEKRFAGIIRNTDGKSWDSYGTYLIKATYGSDTKKAETTFIFNDCGPSNSYDIMNLNMMKPVVKICTKIPTDITFNKIPTTMFAGDEIIFEGKLSSNGQPLSKEQIQIKELDLVEGISKVLVTDTTDINGKFSIPWSVKAAKIEFDTEFKIYAKFDGTSDYKNVASPEQKVLVLKNSGDISWTTKLPTKVEYGDIVKFEGKLTLNKGSPNGAIVYIKDKDLLFDDHLATAIADKDGIFSTYWSATFVDKDGADIYAVFEGNDEYYRQTTCDEGPTYSFGGPWTCKNTHRLTITERTSSPPVPDTYPYDGTEFMKLVYSLPFTDTPKVLIVTTPESFSDVKSHIIPVQEGIEMWRSELDKYGGDWNVDFYILPSGSLFTNYNADIIVNLVKRNEYSDCFAEVNGIYGRAWMVPSLDRAIQTIVCSSSSDYKRDNAGIRSTAAHEFIHAMGLGHTFNKKQDMMCSVENNVQTCPPDGTYDKSKTPSPLNYASVQRIYGTDGFKIPNNDIWTGSFNGIKFTVADYLTGNYLQPIR